MSAWLEVSVTADQSMAEAVADVLQLFALEEDGVTTEQAGDPDDPDPHKLLPEVQVKLVTDAKRDRPQLRTAIAAKLQQAALPPPHFRTIADQDWATQWRQHYSVMRIGRRFWIRPSWLPRPDAQRDEIVLTLDPDRAFGTGTHATTQLCLLAIEDTVAAGDSVLDLGSGSGILAIAAAKLGAAPVLAVDIDPATVDIAHSNSRINNADVEVKAGSLGDVERHDWDVVVANILAVTIEQLLREQQLLDYVAVDGRLILSGILTEQADQIIDAVVSQGGFLLQQYEQDGWVALIINKNGMQ